MSFLGHAILLMESDLLDQHVKLLGHLDLQFVLLVVDLDEQMLLATLGRQVKAVQVGPDVIAPCLDRGLHVLVEPDSFLGGKLFEFFAEISGLLDSLFEGDEPLVDQVVLEFSARLELDHVGVAGDLALHLLAFSLPLQLEMVDALAFVVHEDLEALRIAVQEVV